jgi:non-heme chloroperoxidase
LFVVVVSPIINANHPGQCHPIDAIQVTTSGNKTETRKDNTVPFFSANDGTDIVPYQDASVRAAKLVQDGTLKIYPGFSHGMTMTQAETINPDLLAFIES